MINKLSVVINTKNVSKTLEKTLKSINFADDIVVVDMETQKVVGQITYLSSVEEIYDVQVLPNIMRPNIVHPENEIHELAIDTPFAKFWRKPMKK